MKTLFLPALLCFAWGTPAATGAVEPFLADVLANHPGVRDLALRTDGEELYFSSQSLFGEVSAIMALKRCGENWGEVGLAPFSGDYRDLEPFFSPDGLQLFFASNRPLEAGDPAKDFDIWYVARSNLDSPWGEPVNLGEPVNSGGNEFYPAVTAEGDLYFTSDRASSKGEDDIFHSRREAAGYADPVSLGEAINSEGYEFNAWISPDGRTMIYTAYNREGGLGSGDLYISRKRKDGEWSPSENLGPEINSDRMDYCPFVDTNGLLYFTSKRIAFPAEPYGIRTADELLQITSKPANGQSRLYRASGVDLALTPQN